jgi:hypothetical protein
MTFPVCPCDGAKLAPPVNLPGLPHVAYRVGTYAAFRSAVLSSLAGEQTLSVEQTPSVDSVPVWRTSGAGDLAVMIAEWFAYIADVLTFYNERIANQDYVRTADLPESVAHLIAILGYRPRPAIGATGLLAALVTAGQSATLPAALQFQSKPAPGQSPQTFELHPAVSIGPPDQIPAIPPPVLLAPVPPQPTWKYLIGELHGREYGMVRDFLTEAASSGGSQTRQLVRRKALTGGAIDSAIVSRTDDDYTLLLRGAVDGIDPGASLRLTPRDPSNDPMLAIVTRATIAPAPAGGQQTTLTITLYGTPPNGLTAALARLEQANQNSMLWTLPGPAAINAARDHVHLSSVVRQIHAGDWVLFTQPSLDPSQPSLDPFLVQVVAAVENIRYLTSGSGSSQIEIPIPHTILTLATALPSGFDVDAVVNFGWVSVGTLLDQPFSTWSGTPTTLVASGAQTFPLGLSYPILLQDSAGVGIATTGSSNDGTSLLLGQLPDPVPPLQPPLTILPNVLQVSRGKTVAKEVLGSGDATNPAQSFKLQQSPVTYLQQGATYASTINLTVGGQPWKEVASFYGQPADATVFVTSEDDAGFTHVTFGDGVNGARLPTGVNNVVATYRIGAGAAAPPAGKLTIIGQSYPGLRAVLNPLEVGGGADAAPSDQVKSYAPRSVLAFGRAVSVFDYEAIAALTPGVTRASAVWAWNDAAQRTMVTVYVGDDAAAATAASTALAQAGDPNRPVQVVQATPVPIALSLTLTTVAGMDTSTISANVITALADSQAGLFGTAQLAIGQPVFDSQIEAAVLAVHGAVAITAASFSANGAPDAGPLHNPGEGAYYTLDPTDITTVTEPDGNGG